MYKIYLLLLCTTGGSDLHIEISVSIHQYYKSERQAELTWHVLFRFFCFTWKFQVSLRASDQDCMHRLPRAKRVAAAMADSSRSTFIDQTHNGKINYRGGRLQKNHSRLLQLASTGGDTCRTERVSRVCF